MKLIQPNKLNPGDTIALVSPSSGLAGEENFMWRTDQGIKQIERMGYKVKVMPHALQGIDFNYEHPELRAKDLMDAFLDPEVKAIITTLGGNDSIRLLPYIDFEVIRTNPKILMGYSDTTVVHLMCLKAGLSSFYGQALLTDFAENVIYPAYSKEYFDKTLTQTSPIGNIQTADEVIEYGLKWDIENQHKKRPVIKNDGYKIVNGHGIATGHLIGGCLEVLLYLNGSSIYPTIEQFKGSILFLETSEVITPEWLFEDFMRSLGFLGILEAVNGIIFGRPQNNQLSEEYQEIIKDIMKEWHQEDKPVFFNATFGHNEPKCILPYGAQAELDCEKQTFKILDAGVV